MERGVITAVRDFLFAGWKTIDQEAPGDLGWVRVQVKDADDAVIRPSNIETQIKANKGTVYACVKLIANAVAANPLRVYRPKMGSSKAPRITRVKAVPEPRRTALLEKATPGSAISLADDVEEIVGGHRLVDLLYQVNGVLDNFGLKFLTSSYLSLAGNTYWVLLRDRFKVPSSVWIAPAEYMKVKQDQDALVAGYIYKHGAVKKEFSRDDVVHIKLPAPGSKYQFYGRGDVMGAADAFNLREYIQKFEEALFKNGAVPAGVLTTNVRVSKDERERLRRQFTQKYSGVGNAGKWLVMENVDVKPLSHSPREMAYQGSRKVMLEEIANAFLVPVALLTGQSTTRAALETSLTQIAMFAVKPQCVLIAEAVNAQLCPQYEDNVFVAFDDPVPEDKEFALEQAESDVKLGISTIDEQRQSRGLDPFGGVASEPLVDANRMPLSMLGELDIDRLARMVAEKIHEIAVRN